MPKCNYIYLDADGNPSIHYYGVVNDIGHTAALENYLAHMVPIADVKFSRKFPEGITSVYDWMQKNSKTVKNMPYKERAGYIGMTDIIRKNTEDAGDAPYEAGAVIIKANEIRTREKAKGNYKSAADAKKKAREELGYNEETNTYEETGEFVQLKADARKMYIDQARQGSSIHKLIEFGIDARNRRRKAAMEAENPDPRDPRYNYSAKNSNAFAKEAIEDFKEFIEEADPEKFGNLTQSILNSSANMIGEVLEQIEKLEDEYGTVFEIMPELGILGEKVTYDGKKVYGIADIVLHSEEKNLDIIIDLKTKSEDSIVNFESAYADNMTGKFEGQPGDAAGKVKIQTSGYAVTLQQEMGVDVPKVVSIALPFSTVINEDEDTGERELKFIAYKQDRVRVTSEPPLLGAVEDAFDIESDTPPEPRNMNHDLSSLFEDKLITISDNSRQIQLQEANIKKLKNGKYKWWDPYNRVPIIKSTKEDVKREIKKTFKKLEKQKKEIRIDFVRLFKTGKPRKGSLWASSTFRQKAAFMLEGITPETHEVYTKDDLLELRDVGDDVVVFQNKRTNELTIAIISDQYNTNYSFEKEGEEDARTTLFGTVLTDKVAKSKYGNDIAKADTHNVQLIKAATVAARLKRLNPKKFGKIKALHSMTAMGKVDNFRTSSMGEQLVIIRDLAAELEASNKTVPDDFKFTLESKDLMDPSEYDADPFWALVELIKEGRDPLRGVDATAESRYVARDIAKRIKYLEEEGKSLDSDYVLEKKLASYLKQARLQAAGRKKVSINNTEAIVDDPDYMLANNAYLALKGMYIRTAPKFKGGMLGDFNSIKTINDPFADAAAKNIELSEQRMRDKIAPFVREHDNLIKELIEDSDVTDVDLVSGRDLHRKLFAPMLVDGFEFDKENTDNWMRFKDPDDPNLSKAQKKYIRWYNEKVKEASKMIHTDAEYNYMYPENGKSPSWQEGNIPIIRRINSAGIKEMVTNPKEFLERQVNKVAKPTERKDNDRSQAPWEYDVTYAKQVDGNPGRGSSYTRELMGIADDGKAIPGDKNIETNPITILNSLMINAVKKEHTEHAALAASALDASLAAAAVTFKDAGVDVEPIRNILEKFHGMIIHGKFKQEGAFGKTWDVMGKAMSFGLFFGSWRQFVTETSTATTQITSGTVSGLFNDMLFGADSSKKYSAKDIAWATSQIGSSFAEQIIADFGWYNSDISHFSGDEYNRVRKKSMWQTKWGFYPIHAVLKQGTQSLVLAQMHKEGITRDCFELNKKTGRWEYREENDPRFYVYDKDLKFGQSREPKTKEEKEKYAYWLAHRKKMQKENAIADGRMIRPLTVEHLNSIKNYAVRLLGAMDSKQLLAVENTALGRSLAKFKRWMRQKVDNIYHETEMSEKEGKWVAKYDDGGNVKYEWVADEFEGYIQSAIGLVKELRKQGWSWSEAKKNLSDRRKENISKLLADLILWGLMSYVVYYLLGEDPDAMADELGVDKKTASTFAKDTRKGIMNSLGDIMPLQGMYSIVTGSPSAAAAIMMNFIRSTGISMVSVASGDFEKAKASMDRSLETWGLYRVGEGIVELMTK